MVADREVLRGPVHERQVGRRVVRHRARPAEEVLAEGAAYALPPAFGELIRKIQGDDKKRDFQLTTANSMWGNKDDLFLNAKFLRITQTDYQAGFRLMDFISDAEGSRKTINDWVEDKTNKKIKELLQERQVAKPHASR